MFNISSLLHKVSKNIFSQEENKKQIVYILSQEIGIDIDPSLITIQNNIIYTTLSPGIKNKIFMYKQSILETIIKNTSVFIVDIR